MSWIVNWIPNTQDYLGAKYARPHGNWSAQTHRASVHTPLNYYSFQYIKSNGFLALVFVDNSYLWSSWQYRYKYSIKIDGS